MQKKCKVLSYHLLNFDFLKGYKIIITTVHQFCLFNVPLMETFLFKGMFKNNVTKPIIYGGSYLLGPASLLLVVRNCEK